MDHIKIIKRAFHITKIYRALWLFGILLALTTGINANGSASGGGGGGDGGGNGNNFNPFPGGAPYLSGNWEAFAMELIPIAVALICLALLLAVVLTILRYVSETAVITMVDRYEETEEEVGFREGWRLGWSRPAWRMFLIDLVIGVATAVGIVLLGLIAVAPLLLWLTRNDTVGVLGTIGAIGLGLVFIFLVILIVIALSILSQFFRRACVLEDLGVFDSMRRGWKVARGRLGDTIVMALILFAIGLGAFIVLIPVYILLGLAGLLIGGIPGLAAGFLTSLFSGGALPWMVGAAVGVPLFLLVFALPALFLNGLLKVFASSSWTLTYRELLALENGGAQPVALPAESKAEGPESSESEEE
jgi:hypothetical protein